ncbi:MULTISPECIES: non-heme iron oxygenase ferredoxin subunit [Alcaligenaceae]|jgi:3-phenylpropionate/trans-cinnamate dioxygenase ferredoxin subunit|uniref:Ferredoxin n=1 Tax=Neopusillimonas maritima TaxID=2026239 RepID=A0ABX9MWU6_9BURK|nr:MULTISPECIES: non-heme iron oxygenase ferredoxin subunit [Alcaligenaceae]QIM48428.1 non-heme iron oxygenase ferredoxin subunit [Pusillimonas sp. DMV24BSW_D]RII82501.1 ferredoxin [Neopusillimonas maritima]|tara:strand:+ start:376 stop:681 length:306 start_codon:yes stop_codon:yes gene_type:complete
MNWIKIATVGQIEEDESLGVELEGKQLAVHHTEGEYFVTDNICTHQFALLSDGFIEDGCVECPLHQAMFDLRTGEPKSAPATEPVKVYEVKVEGDEILVNL